MIITFQDNTDYDVSGMTEKEIGNLLHKKSLEMKGKQLAKEGVYYMLNRECLPS